MKTPKIAILGYGLEGKSVEKYFKSKKAPYEIEIFEKFPFEKPFNYKDYLFIFRSPSIPLHKLPKEVRLHLTSSTSYFFLKCPAPIIGVTGTKGKGTTCTMITELLAALGKTVHLVGNIGAPALDFLDKIKKDDVVVFELSSFQLWDLTESPDVAVALRIEPDHLNVHDGFEDYLDAKANIARHQYPEDTFVYFRLNSNTKKLANLTPARHFAYPYIVNENHVATDFENTPIGQELLSALPLLGEHNRENLEAALLAAYAYLHPITSKPERFTVWLEKNKAILLSAIEKMTPLPHHIEFVRELNGVKYYDDSFCTVFPALDVALKSFETEPLVLIAGGSSKGTDLTPAKRAIFDKKNLVKAVLIGETAAELAKGEDPEKYVLAGTDFEQAIKTARSLAEEAGKAIVLLSPCAASFDMFSSYKARGDEFKRLVSALA